MTCTTEVTYDTCLRDWYLISFETAKEELEADMSGIQILWGIVANKKGRKTSGFRQLGNWIMTTKIVEKLAEDLYQTENTLYKLEGQGEIVILPLPAIVFLQMGIGPGDFEDYLLIFEEMKKEGMIPHVDPLALNAVTDYVKRKVH